MKKEEKLKLDESASGKKTKFLGKVAKLRGKNLEGLQHKALVISKEYEVSIKAANELQPEYYKVQMVSVMQGFQKLENDRLEQMKKKASIYLDQQKKHAEILASYYNEIDCAIGGFHPGTEMKLYTQRCVNEYGLPQPPIPFTYLFRFDIAEIEAGKMYDPDSTFGCTLRRLMELQATTHPEDKVPYIFTQLVNQIKRMGGLETEGIFRISIDRKDLDKLKKEVQKGEFNRMQQEMTAHAPACLLKTWLNLIPQSIINYELYDTAIHMGKKADTRREDYLALHRKLDSHRKNLLSALANLAAEVNQNSDKNKMTFTNLGVVFSPAILDKPGLDPFAIMQDAKYKVKFTTGLFEALSKQNQQL